MKGLVFIQLDLLLEQRRKVCIMYKLEQAGFIYFFLLLDGKFENNDEW